jgi:hypothetical protein
MTQQLPGRRRRGAIKPSQSAKRFAELVNAHCTHESGTFRDSASRNLENPNNGTQLETMHRWLVRETVSCGQQKGDILHLPDGVGRARAVSYRVPVPQTG